MELWYTEEQTRNMRLSLRIKESLYSGQSKFQKIDVLDTFDFGRLLVLDGLVMTTEKDEFVYHEAINHIPILTHDNPENVLIIGGGDGGSLREAVKHHRVKKVTMVEIDGEVVKIAKKFFPSLHGGWDHPKSELRIEDGFEFLRNNDTPFNVIIIDSTDPIGPGEILFQEKFYDLVMQNLSEDGIMVQQTESFWVHPHIINKISKTLMTKFATVKFFSAPIPTYPSGYWNFSYCSNLKNYNPIEHFKKEEMEALGRLKFLNADILQASFALPNFAIEALQEQSK